MFPAQRLLEIDVSKFVLTEENKVGLSALQLKEIGESIRPNAHLTGSGKENQVHASQGSWSGEKSLSDFDLVLRPVAATAVQIRHLRQNTAVRSREQPRQRRHRLGRLCCGSTAVMPVSDAQTRCQRHQCLN